MKLMKFNGVALGWIAVLLASPAAWAGTSYEWVLQSGPCYQNCSGSTTTKNFASSPGGINVETQSWKQTTASNTTLESTTHYMWSGGLGVNWDGGSPQHSTDSSGPDEAILFDFGEEVVLDGLKLGWAQDGSSYNGHADITILAYTGGAPFSGVGGLKYEASADPLSLINNGWTHISDYADVQADKNNFTGINAGAVSSQYWLVGAFNWRFGTDTVCTDFSKHDDYAKIYALSGTRDNGPPQGGTVPVPATLWLLGLGLPLVARRGSLFGNR